MAGKILSNRQQQIIGDCMSGLVLLLYSHNHQWNVQQRKDIEAAYAALGVKAPFSFENAPDTPPTTKWERAKALLKRPLFARKPPADQQPEPITLP